MLGRPLQVAPGLCAFAYRYVHTQWMAVVNPVMWRLRTVAEHLGSPVSAPMCRKQACQQLSSASAVQAPPAAGAESAVPRIVSRMSEVAQHYDAFILDQWGVLHDGSEAMDGAVDGAPAAPQMAKDGVSDGVSVGASDSQVLDAADGTELGADQGTAPGVIDDAALP